MNPIASRRGRRFLVIVALALVAVLVAGGAMQAVTATGRLQSPSYAYSDPWGAAEQRTNRVHDSSAPEARSPYRPPPAEERAARAFTLLAVPRLPDAPSRPAPEGDGARDQVVETAYYTVRWTDSQAEFVLAGVRAARVPAGSTPEEALQDAWMRSETYNARRVLAFAQSQGSSEATAERSALVASALMYAVDRAEERAADARRLPCLDSTERTGCHAVNLLADLLGASVS